MTSGGRLSIVMKGDSKISESNQLGNRSFFLLFRCDDAWIVA